MTTSSLICTELRLRNYRNFEELRLEVPVAGAAVIGDNGSGKTNLVEAVYYLEIFRSFRGASDEQLVRFGEDAFFIRGRFEDPSSGRSFVMTAAYEPRTKTKRITVDGAEPERLSDALGKLGAVVFSPSDVGIVSGGPSERRRFLDIVLSLNVPGYVSALQRYRQVLRHRNAMLREQVAQDVLESFEEGLIQAGARLTVDRAAWVADHAERFSALYREISDGLSARIEYDADVPFDGERVTLDDAAASFRERLSRVARRERDRGVTLAGPHKDDVALKLESGVDLRQYGSGGQMRTGAIALRFIEADTICSARGCRPLMLLDDVFAELDPGRSRRIIELFQRGEHGQVLLTAPKQTDVDVDALVEGSVVHWRIAHGRIDP